MIRNKARLCKHENCTKFASYGSPVSRIREYCPTHHPDGFINLNIHKKILCIHEDCLKYADYGSPETRKREYCATHLD